MGKHNGIQYIHAASMEQLSKTQELQHSLKKNVEEHYKLVPNH